MIYRLFISTQFISFIKSHDLGDKFGYLGYSKFRVTEFLRILIPIFENHNKQMEALVGVNQVKDIFLFGCFTGPAYIDVKLLARNNIGIGIDGEKWIFTNRQKTDTCSNIPLLPMAEEILNKYKEHPQCLNEGRLLLVLSNQKMNAYLKEIADICGIHKELTFHIARHTFCHYSYSY